MNIEDMIEGGETKRVEFKESLRLKSEIGKTVSSFSNAEGGTIVVGVTDSGELTGVELGENSLERLANQIKQHTDPKIYPKIHS
ncbi:MAG: helix-turn-helix domain-containing protein, partial [Candidatus Aenigmatarchaeota archaeon]